MKVTRKTDAQLVLDYVPWFLAIMLTLFTLIFAGAGLGILIDGELAGLIFIFFGGGMGAIALVVFVERLQVVLNRETGKIRLRRQTLRGYKEELHELADLRGACVQSTTSSKGGTTYRPALILTEGNTSKELPITQVYSSGQGAQRAVDAINDWLGPVAEMPVPGTPPAMGEIPRSGPARGFPSVKRDPSLGDVLTTFPRNSGRLLDYLDAAMCAPGALSRGEREMIAAHVSEQNATDYCVIAHAAHAEACGIDTMKPAPKLQALLDYAAAVNAGGGAAIDHSYDVASAAGWSEAALYEAVEICGLFNLVNRIVRAAGIEPQQNLPVSTAATPDDHSYRDFAVSLGLR